MTEPATPPDPTAPLPPAAVRVWWHRIAVYSGSIALIIAMWICGILYTIREHPERFVAGLQAQLPFPSSTGKVSWQNRRTLEIDDVKLGNFFYAETIIVTASPFGLLQRHVAKVEVIGGELFTGALYDTMEKIPTASNSKGNSKGLDWTIGRLEVSRGTVMLQKLSPDLPAIPVRLGARHPIILHNLKLGAPDDSPEMNIEQKAEIVNVNILSPFDPVAPVFSFPLIRVRFTYQELWHHQIREVELMRPTMFLGEDLFWFTGQFEKQRNALPAQGPTAPWQIHHFEVDYGQLAVNAFGQPVVHLPFFLQTKVDNIRLDQLDKISAKSTIAIQRLDQDYPDYKINLVGLTGQLYFSLPPTNDTANNVVTTIKVEEMSWNDIPVKNISSGVTFDPNGVYVKLNGGCEGGQLTGNFEFYYSKGFTWNADFFADKINCQPIAEKLGGKYLDLTGELDGKISVQGKITDIQKCQGTLTLPHPGVLKIKSLDDLLDRLPADTSALKKDVLKIAIDSFKTYPYLSGQLNVDYKPEGGVGTLQLDSLKGQRKFSMYWHPYGADDKTSKVAKDADNQ